jgi:hypothetical protein
MFVMGLLQAFATVLNLVLNKGRGFFRKGTRYSKISMLERAGDNFTCVSASALQ